ncbi:hypothetical protein JTB14_037508 [Gonioctena quinquepunctata]|nr:hypothetical protein JTB14_037508 [Gonioctena quinquepunctata]
MTGNCNLLTDITDKNAGQEMIVANNTKLFVNSTGNSVIKLKHGGTERIISEVKYVPDMSVNLLSVNSMVSKGYSVFSDSEGCRIMDQNQCNIEEETIATAKNIEGLCELEVFPEQVNIAKVEKSQMLWHKRLGHLNHFSMKLLKDGLATGMTYKEKEKPEICESCIKGKQSRVLFFHYHIQQVMGPAEKDLTLNIDMYNAIFRRHSTTTRVTNIIVTKKPKVKNTAMSIA